MQYKFNPYSKNIIFFDTEFSSNDPYEGEILSIGLVKLNGDSLYLELDHKGPVDKWVKKNILPTLNAEKVKSTKAIKRIKKFVGKKKPFAVTYVNQYDIIYLHKLFKSKNIDDLPFYWIPIDFASVLFGNGINPKSYYPSDKSNFFKELGVDSSKF